MIGWIRRWMGPGALLLVAASLACSSYPAHGEVTLSGPAIVRIDRRRIVRIEELGPGLIQKKEAGEAQPLVIQGLFVPPLSVEAGGIYLSGIRVADPDHPVIYVTRRDGDGGYLLGGRIREDELKMLFTHLHQSSVGEADVPTALLISRVLSMVPESTVPFLRDRLRDRLPLSAPDRAAIARLIPRLDSDDFRVREDAFKRLEAYGGLAAPELRRALDSSPSPEVRKRLEDLLEAFSAALAGGDARPPADPVRRQSEVNFEISILEHTGTKEARELLETLAERGLAEEDHRRAREALLRFTLRPDEEQARGR